MAIFFILTIFVLFSPIKYDIELKKNNFLSVKINFLFKLFEIYYTKKDGNGSFFIKFAFKVMSNNNNKPKEVYKNNGLKLENKQNPEKALGRKKIYEPKGKSENNGNILKSINILKPLLNNPHMKDILKHTTQMIIEELKALKPVIFNMRGILGFDSPEKTGYALGFVSIVKSVTALDIAVEGNFEKAVFSLDLIAKGKTNFFVLLLPLLKWALRKPIWVLLKPLIFNRKKR